MGLRFKSNVNIDAIHGGRFDATILIGYPEDEEHHSEMSVAEMAELQSEGTEFIPPRPHLQEGLEYGFMDIERAIKDHARLVIGPIGSKDGLEKVAEAARQGVLDYVYSGALPPNAPSTIRGKHSEQPLVETGQMIDALETRVERGGK